MGFRHNIKGSEQRAGTNCELIFQQSLNTGEVPDDLLTANVTAIFKKGTKVFLQVPASIPAVVIDISNL